VERARRRGRPAAAVLGACIAETAWICMSRRRWRGPVLPGSWLPGSRSGAA